jgi:hypothetical protein
VLRRLSMFFLIFVLMMVVAVPAYAQESGPDDATAPGDSGAGGFVSVQGASAPAANAPVTFLTYHGGPIMKSSKVFTIFWLPAGYVMAPNYINIINQYFKDVAAASGATSNVYYTEKQYYMLPGPVHVSGNTAFGGSYIDTQPFPANGCSLYAGYLTKCLSDAQIQTEVKRVIALKGWTANAINMFFMFTPKNVGSCYSGSSCAFTAYCAYHGYSGAVTYANQPYTYTNASACGVPKSPNGNFAADSTINVTSHEHREAINDYHLNAWWDSSTGDEGSDKCAWNFGSLLAGYNQTINGRHYVLQKEWSNASAGCVLTGN